MVLGQAMRVEGKEVDVLAEVRYCGALTVLCADILSSSELAVDGQTGRHFKAKQQRKRVSKETQGRKC